METEKCLFCEIAKGTQPSVKVWENEGFLAIKNKFPQAPIHILVIPKNHVSKQQLFAEETVGFWEEMMQVTMKVVKTTGLSQSGYKLVNNGAGYNHFDHEHVHILGGAKTEPGGAT